MRRTHTTWRQASQYIRSLSGGEGKNWTRDINVSIQHHNSCSKNCAKDAWTHRPTVQSSGTWVVVFEYFFPRSLKTSLTLHTSFSLHRPTEKVVAVWPTPSKWTTSGSSTQLPPDVAAGESIFIRHMTVSLQKRRWSMSPYMQVMINFPRNNHWHVDSVQ